MTAGRATLPLPPHHPGLPKLLLPADLSPDLIATLNVLPFMLVASRAAPGPEIRDADHLAAMMAEVIAPISPCPNCTAGAAHQFRAPPPQTFTRLMQLAALCVETANELARQTEFTADPMRGFSADPLPQDGGGLGRGFTPAIVSVPA